MVATSICVDFQQSVDHNLIFAIGDVHGRMDLLERAVDVIRNYSRRSKKLVVFLGDYIDRGAESSAVVEYLSSRSGRRLTCLQGNHEQMLLAANTGRDSRQFQMWLAHGGDQTLRSYGCAANMESLDHIPVRHIHWLSNLPRIAFDAHLIYVHAGLSPGEPFLEQTEQEFLWIREKFLRAPSLADFPDGRHIVHGHTPQWSGKRNPELPELLEHRTNIDTAAYATGTLTIAVFDPNIAGGPIDVLAIRNTTVLLS